MADGRTDNRKRNRAVARARRGRQGLTLLELVAVLLLLSIMAVVVLSRGGSTDIEAITQAEVIKTHLRYAQSRALNTSSIWSVQFSGGSYTLYKNGSPHYFLGQDSTTVSMSGGLSDSLGLSPIIVSFDTWGRPCTDAAGQNQQPSNRTLTVGSPGVPINITGNTGYIP